MVAGERLSYDRIAKMQLCWRHPVRSSTCMPNNKTRGLVRLHCIISRPKQ